VGRSVAPMTVRVVVAGVFVAAGLLKAWSPDGMARVVAFLLPVGLRSYPSAVLVGTAVAMFEVGLGLAIALAPRRRGVLVTAIVTLLAFSAVLGVLATSAGAPGCGCLGFLSTADARLDAIAGIGRNVALIWMTAWLLGAWHAPTGAPRVPVAGRPSGFSLVELLVAISVVAILIAIALPVLSHARGTSRIAARVQTIRQLNAALSTYGEDFRDRFPYFGTPGDPYGPITIRGFEIGGQYFQAQRWHWASAVFPEYYAAPRHSIEPPERAQYMQQFLGYPAFIIAADHQITSTVFARTRFWEDDPGGGTAWYQSSYFSPTRPTDVAFPALKGLLIADLGGPGGRPPGWREDFPAPVAFADGSARAVPLRDLDPDPSRAVERPFGAVPIPVLSTRGGLAGRDF
jgi:prepilin-type N-terminal cleavage/methylation domain-containing protein